MQSVRFICKTHIIGTWFEAIHHKETFVHENNANDAAATHD